MEAGLGSKVTAQAEAQDSMTWALLAPVLARNWGTEDFVGEHHAPGAHPALSRSAECGDGESQALPLL